MAGSASRCSSAARGGRVHLGSPWKRLGWCLPAALIGPPRSAPYSWQGGPHSVMSLSSLTLPAFEEMLVHVPSSRPLKTLLVLAIPGQASKEALVYTYSLEACEEILVYRPLFQASEEILVHAFTGQDSEETLVHAHSFQASEEMLVHVFTGHACEETLVHTQSFQASEEMLVHAFPGQASKKTLVHTHPFLASKPSQPRFPRSGLRGDIRPRSRPRRRCWRVLGSVLVCCLLEGHSCALVHGAIAQACVWRCCGC
ncbi:hypothetical protein NDU88_006891 [Pleurodeles waltl]|uniref:Uncharacterized protein n=1 Tax=Pleurodeles waltl TaxID=8319 RepID=A0AAV7MEC5_PLEWA|nr:hypothetical protein NDU88_006891 [Pleurodeles waltl]